MMDARFKGRRKKQRIRHDVEEISLWPDMRCRHLHHPQEWMPQIGEDSSTWYPSKEEAEYTACLVFHIVYSVSSWSFRVGKAKLAIPRRPPVECTGDRRDWLGIDARAFREWSMPYSFDNRLRYQQDNQSSYSSS